MRFTFVDRVTELEPNVRITTVKALSLAEEYLADHFPRFPVMPGVLMLEAMAQAGAWLVRVSDDFAHSMVLLKEVKSIKFADFVVPGRILVVTAEISKETAREVYLKSHGAVEGRIAVAGRLVLERFNLAEEDADLAPTDAYVCRALRDQWSMLYRPVEPLLAAGGGEHNGAVETRPTPQATVADPVRR